MKVKTVGQLKSVLERLEDNIPIGVYYKRFWTPLFDPNGAEIEVVEKGGTVVGVATDLDYHQDY